MAAQQKLITIDPTQQGALNEVFPCPPLLTSHHTNWDKIYLEHHRNRHDTPEHCVSSNGVVVLLEPFQTNLRLDGHFQRDWAVKGSVALFPANISIQSVARDWVSFITLTLDPMFFKSVAQELMYPDRNELVPHFPTQQDLFILGIALALKSELESECLGGRLYYESIATALAVHLLRNYCTFAPAIADCTNRLPQYKLKQAIAYLNEHLAEDVTLDAIAQELNISQYYFCHLFKQSMGISPHKYRMQQRMERAKQLLATDKLSVAEVAHRVGFFNQSHFTKQFRKLVGITPGGYRNSL